MADRGRDLKIAVISDADKFDLSGPADELDNLGKQAKNAGDDIDKTGKDLDGLAKDATETARKVDSAFEKIAASSKSNLRKVDDDADHAAKGLDEFKDEASGSGREAAASFSGGFDDITDLIQETAANAFAGFGPIGAAAGIAAAAGIGFIVNKINESKERVNELTQTFLDLRKDGIDPAADAASHMVDNLDAAQLKDFKNDADALGISYQVMKDALDGNADALKIVTDAIKEQNDAASIQTTNAGTLGGNLYPELSGRLKEVKEATDNATTAMQFLNTESETSKQRTEDLSGALQGVEEDAADMAKAIEDGVDAVIAAQEKQLTASLNFETNTKKVLDRLGQDAVDWALAQGDAADEAMQLLADAPVKKGEQIVANYRKLGSQSSQANASGLLAGKPSIARAVDEIHADMRARLAQKINIPVGVTAPSDGEAIAVRARMRRALSMPLTIPIQYQDVGNYRKVP